MNVQIRKTNISEFHETVYLTREVFWNLYDSGCKDHLILHNFRKSEDFIEELDVVAIFQEKIAGHIITTKSKVIGPNKEVHEVLHVGPVSVATDLHGKGIGSMLINYSIEKAREMGFSAMILFGNPGYYSRFGFKNAEAFKITTSEGLNFDPFQALELKENGLMNVTGKFYPPASIQYTEEELEEFEKQFPKKKKGEPKFKIIL
ncbi:MAG: GNAT family N-acetyltransferase [Salinivirgaceae bacterium]|nr:MAG: GNAT family N-acetyltransferase [Salinivirgaceae bacterium]